MNWAVILILSALGVLTGLITMQGWIDGMEWPLAILTWLLMAVVLGRFATKKVFLHGFLTGIISSLIGSVMVYFFFDTYVANSSRMAEAISKAPEGFDMRSIMLWTAPINAALGGVLVGLLAMLGAKIFGTKPAPVAPVVILPPEEKDQTQP
ncbi:hypothetical protein EHM69_09775 [candidate division KSB1 bacterium]|nr:MAG: hypothetical protein EHM69_09775 [candidate division KSB1 bacterium]